MNNQLVDLISTIIQSIVLITILKRITRISLSKIQLIIYTLLIIFDGQIFSLLTPPDIATVLSILGLIIIGFAISRKNLLSVILSLIFGLLLITVGNMVGVWIVGLVLEKDSYSAIIKNYYSYSLVCGIQIVFIITALKYMKWFIIFHNSIVRSKKLTFVIGMMLQFLLFYIISVIEINSSLKNTYKYFIIGIYIAIFVASLFYFILEYFSAIEKQELVQTSQKIVKQFQNINNNYASQLLKMQALINLSDYEKLKPLLKKSIEEVRNSSLIISKNLDPLFSEGLQLLKEKNVDLTIDNQLDNLRSFKIDTLSMISILNCISAYITKKVNVSNKPITLKIRDYYDQAYFIFTIKEIHIKGNNKEEIQKAYEDMKTIIESYNGKVSVKDKNKFIVKILLPKHI